MNSMDFINNYNMHDSLINKIDVLDDGTSIVLWIDFAFWMQKDYNGSIPETGIIKITFTNVSAYSIPENINWNEISILKSYIDKGNIKFSLINDKTDAYFEISLCSNVINVDTILDE